MVPVPVNRHSGIRKPKSGQKSVKSPVFFGPSLLHLITMSLLRPFGMPGLCGEVLTHGGGGLGSLNCFQEDTFVWTKCNFGSDQ